MWAGLLNTQLPIKLLLTPHRRVGYLSTFMLPLSLSLAQTTSADPSRGLLSQLTRVQNGVVSVCAEGATSLSWPIRLRPNQLPGAGGRVFPELAFLSRRPHSTRWAAASKPPPLLPLSPLRLPVSPRVDSYVKCCLGVFRVVFCAAACCELPETGFCVFTFRS